MEEASSELLEASSMLTESPPRSYLAGDATLHIADLPRISGATHRALSRRADLTSVAPHLQLIDPALNKGISIDCAAHGAAPYASSFHFCGRSGKRTPPGSRHEDSEPQAPRPSSAGDSDPFPLTRGRAPILQPTVGYPEPLLTLLRFSGPVNSFGTESGYVN